MSGLPPAQPRSDALNFGVVHTRKYFGHLSATGVSATTISSMTSAEAPFDYVRVVFLNASSNSYSVTKAAVAPTAGIGDGFTPSGGNSSFQTLTFNNGGAFGLPPSPSGSTNTVTVPAATGSGSTLVYGVAASDWMPCPSLERTDSVGSNIHLLLIRSYASGTQYGLKAVSEQCYNSWQQPSINLGRPYRTFFKSGDCVTTPANFTSPTENQNYGGIGMVVQFMSRTRGLSVLGVGDSLTQGHEYTANASCTATIGGTITVGDVITLTATNAAISALPATASYTIQGSDTTTTIATALASAISGGVTPSAMGLAGLTRPVRVPSSPSTSLASPLTIRLSPTGSRARLRKRSRS